MIRTGIPVSVLEQEGDVVVATMVDVLNAEAEEENQDQQPEFVDPNDPATIPEEWK